MDKPRFQIFVFCLCSFMFDSASSNQPPLVHFGPPAGNVFFEETTPIGTKLFTITAEDSDSASVTFVTDSTATAALVTVSSPPTHIGDIWSVDIVLNAPLDRDRNPNTRDLLFEVSDGASTIEGRVKLIIRDVNDNPPMFIDLPYSISLQEGTAKINKTVLIANATDPDDGPGRTIVYSMTAHAQGADDTYNRTFVIPDENMGNIIQALELDYETRSYYQYKVFAKDRGNPACPGPECRCSNVTEPNVNCAGDAATFTVTVIDVQDSPPYFERLPYIAQVQENATAGTSFYQVSALDGDRGVPNAVSYSIVNAANYLFTIDAQSGILRVGAQGLDADQPGGRNYFLTVMASEVIEPGQQAGGETSATTQVSITVHDVNDNSPEFTQAVYYASVQENTPRGVPLTFINTIEVTDKDQGANSQFSLSVEKDGAPYDVFSTLPGASDVVSGMTTVMVAVHNSSVLDFETTQNLTFQVKATETSTAERYSNTTTIILTILDMNDNSPVFLPDQPIAVNVTEHENPDVVLATFSATDADDGSYGTVGYSLEDDLGKFAIGTQSGNLTVMADLDREEPGGAAYSLVVVATDNMAGDESQRRSTRLNIRVTVLDVNDNPPVFQTHAPTVTVQENASPNTALMTLTASDIDAGINADVMYKVVSIESAASLPDQPQDLFAINEKTGVVFVNASLIGYPGAHNVTFLAFDSAGEAMNDSTVVVVYVQDVNINKPVFVVPDQQWLNLTLNRLPNITVDEEEPIGTLILLLNATDKDTGANGKVYYSLDADINGQFDYFAVGPIHGNLTNTKTLDREQTDMYQINLKARDQGSPTQLSTVIPFRVYLRDINDNEPEFPPPASLSLSVGEETKNVLVGFVNVAIDRDSDPQNKIICYYVYGGQMASSFFLIKTTGELRLLTELDRDVTPSVSLVVKASAACNLREDRYLANYGNNNTYNASDNSLLQVLVKVDDINDNPPVFDDDALTVGLLYDREIGFEVINLVKYTRDEDTPANSVNYFRLLRYRLAPDMPEEASPPFSVSRNGSVVTNRLFAADEKGYFVLTVEAYDNDSATADDVANVTIYLVSNIQRVKLVFNKQPNAVELIKGDVTTRLGVALGMKVIADKIATHITTGGKADPERTDMYIHARNKETGEIIPASELWNAFDYNLAVRDIFQDFGVVETLPVILERDKDDDGDLEKAFIIVAVLLAIICIVLIVVLCNTIRRYRRRLRAATTSAFVSKKDVTQNYVPPGTNKYYAAENPLFGKDVKAVDVDRLGADNDNDSLDDNAVDSNNSGNDKEMKEEEQEMYLELYDDDNPGMHINHLAMVLQEYERENQEDPEGPHSPPPYLSGSQGDLSEKWRSSSPNGHVKSDSGYNDRASLDGVEGPGLDRLQYSDI